MRVIIAGILGGIAMYVWATVAHLSPLAAVGVHTMPNESFVVGVLQTDLGSHGGVFIYPSPNGDEKANHLTPKGAGMLTYKPHAPTALSPGQLGTEFALELIEAMLLAGVLSLAAAGFGARVAIGVLVGVIAGMATNLSYWNWWGFGADYTIANAFIELVKFAVAGLVIAGFLARQAPTPRLPSALGMSP
jgi:hypothetical protein